MDAFAMVPAEVSSSGSVMSSGMDAATIGTQLMGVATVTSPAPERSAACPAIVAAPLFWLMKVVSPTLITTTERLGRAMIIVAKKGFEKPILESADINALT